MSEIDAFAVASFSLAPSSHPDCGSRPTTAPTEQLLKTSDVECSPKKEESGSHRAIDRKDSLHASDSITTTGSGLPRPFVPRIVTGEVFTAADSSESGDSPAHTALPRPSASPLLCGVRPKKTDRPLADGWVEYSSTDSHSPPLSKSAIPRHESVEEVGEDCVSEHLVPELTDGSAMYSSGSGVSVSSAKFDDNDLGVVADFRSVSPRARISSASIAISGGKHAATRTHAMDSVSDSLLPLSRSLVPAHLKAGRSKSDSPKSKLARRRRTRSHRGSDAKGTLVTVVDAATDGRALDSVIQAHDIGDYSLSDNDDDDTGDSGGKKLATDKRELLGDDGNDSDMDLELIKDEDDVDSVTSDSEEEEDAEEMRQKRSYDMFEDSIYDKFIFLVNMKSGGKKGWLIASEVSKYDALVFDMSDLSKSDENKAMLGAALDGYEGSCMVIICGGDGSINWGCSLVESSINIMKKPISFPVTACLPLGTGNDFSRSLGWGAQEPITKDFIVQMADLQFCSKITKRWSNVDRWHLWYQFDDIECEALSEYKDDHCRYPETPEGLQKYARQKMPLPLVDYFGSEFGRRLPFTMLCYMSFGWDAHVAFKFEEERRKHPERSASQAGNQFAYFRHGFTEFFKPSDPINGAIDVVIDGEPMTLPTSCRSFKLMNINSAANGIFYWGTSKSRRDELQTWSTPRLDDGKLEVMATRGVHDMLTYRANVSHAHRIAQAKDIKIIVKKVPLAMQVDGEAWLLRKPCSLHVRLHSKLPTVIGYKEPRGVDDWLLASLEDEHIHRAKMQFRKVVKRRYRLQKEARKEAAVLARIRSRTMSTAPMDEDSTAVGVAVGDADTSIRDLDVGGILADVSYADVDLDSTLEAAEEYLFEHALDLDLEDEGIGSASHSPSEAKESASDLSVSSSIGALMSWGKSFFGTTSGGSSPGAGSKTTTTTTTTAATSSKRSRRMTVEERMEQDLLVEDVLDDVLERHASLTAVVSDVVSPPTALHSVATGSDTMPSLSLEGVTPAAVAAANRRHSAVPFRMSHSVMSAASIGSRHVDYVSMYQKQVYQLDTTQWIDMLADAELSDMELCSTPPPVAASQTAEEFSSSTTTTTAAAPLKRFSRKSGSVGSTSEDEIDFDRMVEYSPDKGLSTFEMPAAAVCGGGIGSVVRCSSGESRGSAELHSHSVKHEENALLEHMAVFSGLKSAATTYVSDSELLGTAKKAVARDSATMAHSIDYETALKAMECSRREEYSRYKRSKSMFELMSEDDC